MTGAEMKAAREEAGLRGVEIARELGVTPETVSRWESGKYPIPGMGQKLFEGLVGDVGRVERILANRRQVRLAGKALKRVKETKTAKNETKPREKGLNSAVCETKSVSRETNGGDLDEKLNGILTAAEGLPATMPYGGISREPNRWSGPVGDPDKWPEGAEYAESGENYSKNDEKDAEIDQNHEINAVNGSGDEGPAAQTDIAPGCGSQAVPDVEGREGDSAPEPADSGIAAGPEVDKLRKALKPKFQQWGRRGVRELAAKTGVEEFKLTAFGLADGDLKQSEVDRVLEVIREMEGV